MNKRMTYTGVNRRQFLATTSTAIAAPRSSRGTFSGPAVRAAQREGERGHHRLRRRPHHLRELLKLEDVQVMAEADPCDSANYERFYFKGVAGRNPVQAEIEKHYSARNPAFKCAEYEDFRVMLEREKAIDAVLVATPDDVHAPAAIRAMRAGKHVYCEKPMAHNVWDARMFARVAKETGVATQLGNQGLPAMESARPSIFRDGAIGTVREIHAWSMPAVGSRPRSADGHAAPASRVQPRPVARPRPERPYHPDYAPTTGADGGRRRRAPSEHGVPQHRRPGVGVRSRNPTSIEASAPTVSMPNASPRAPTTSTCRRGDRPALRLNWYDGGLRPEIPSDG